MNTPNFPENCMKSKEFGRPGGGVRPSRPPPRSANEVENGLEVAGGPTAVAQEGLIPDIHC